MVMKTYVCSCIVSFLVQIAIFTFSYIAYLLLCLLPKLQPGIILPAIIFFQFSNKSVTIFYIKEFVMLYCIITEIFLFNFVTNISLINVL